MYKNLFKIAGESYNLQSNDSQAEVILPPRRQRQGPETFLVVTAGVEVRVENTVS